LDLEQMNWALDEQAISTMYNFLTKKIGIGSRRRFWGQERGGAGGTAPLCTCMDQTLLHTALLLDLRHLMLSFVMHKNIFKATEKNPVLQQPIIIN
jgi:hypothetical protein